MHVTKLEHATLWVQSGGDALLIDPGSYTAPLADLSSVVAVVITHEHPDHWSASHLDSVREAAPSAQFFAPTGVVQASGRDDITEVFPGETISAGAFTLRFFGGRHEVIHSSIPVVDNVGVLVNDALYYPGDSYAVPEGVAVDLLAAPLGAPWLRIADAIDFVLAVAPRRVFGTHDMTLSDAGRALHRNLLQPRAEGVGAEFLHLDPGDSVDV